MTLLQSTWLAIFRGDVIPTYYVARRRRCRVCDRLTGKRIADAGIVLCHECEDAAGVSGTEAGSLSLFRSLLQLGATRKKRRLCGETP